MNRAAVHIIFLVYIALILVGCGVRKTENNIAKYNQDQIANTNKQILESAREKHKQQSESVKADKSSNETTETTTTTEYDKDTGKPTKSTTTIKIGKSKGNSYERKNESQESEKIKILTIREKQTITIKSSIYEKHKKTATNRNGLYVALVLIGIFAVFMIYLKFK